MTHLTLAVSGRLPLRAQLKIRESGITGTVPPTLFLSGHTRGGLGTGYGPLWHHPALSDGDKARGAPHHAAPHAAATTPHHAGSHASNNPVAAAAFSPSSPPLRARALFTALTHGLLLL